MADDKSYIEGLEDAFTLMKKLQKMSWEERRERFDGVCTLDDIFANNDIFAIKDKIDAGRKVTKTWMIRGWDEDMVIDTIELNEKPYPESIAMFLKTHSRCKYATVDEVYR